MGRTARTAIPLLAILHAVGAAAQPLSNGTCDNGVITAQTDRPELVGPICKASDRALEIFAECGLALPKPVRIVTRTEITGNCLGLFHCGEELIEVLTPDAITRSVDADGLYAHIPPDEMFASVVIHELTHALYDHTPCAAEFTECFVTSEYLAYALQFEALPEEFRAPWMESFDPEETVARDAIGLGMLMLKTDRFALSAWAHLGQRDDRCSWLNGIIDGTIVFDRPRP